MNMTLHYLFDPLCGWCYGASPALSKLAEAQNITLELLPTGLFSGAGARPMGDDFAAYAWENDQRIAHMTGQPFSALYRKNVLQDRQQQFDSGPATVALTAVSQSQTIRQLDALKAIQHARYVEGLDVTSLPVLADILRALGLESAAENVLHPAENLLKATHNRTVRARQMMQEYGARGVPTFIAESGSTRQIINSGLVYSNPQEWVRQLQNA